MVCYRLFQVICCGVWYVYDICCVVREIRVRVGGVCHKLFAMQTTVQLGQRAVYDTCSCV
jgi:hypothetical protein